MINERCAVLGLDVELPAHEQHLLLVRVHADEHLHAKAGHGEFQDPDRVVAHVDLVLRDARDRARHLGRAFDVKPHLGGIHRLGEAKLLHHTDAGRARLVGRIILSFPVVRLVQVFLHLRSHTR